MSPILGYLISFLILASGSLYLFFTWRRFDYPVRWIFGTGLFVRIIYLLSIRPGDQANDWDGHLYYIKFIADRGLLPKWYECYECTHPPVFHSLFAALLTPVRELGWTEDVSLQWASLFFFSVALAGLLSFLRNVIGRPEVLRWAALLLTFWPRGIALSVTINNDLGAYICTALALDAVTRRRWVAGSLSAAVGLLCKTSAIVVYPSLVAWRFLTERKWKWRTGMNAMIAFGMIVLTSYTYYNRGGNVTAHNAIIGNDIGIGQDIRLENGIGNYLCFDLESFVTYPDIAFNRDGQGRQCLWNFLLKTSLVTEHYVTEPVHRGAAIVLSVLLMLLVALSWLGAWNLYRRDRAVFWLWTCLLASEAAGMCLIRFQLPMSATGDFRYIFPAAAPFAGFVASAFGALPRTRWLTWVMRVLIAAFVLTSIAYYLVPLRR